MKILTLFLMAAAMVNAQPAGSRRLILISIDGLMPRTLRNAEKMGLKAPNLIALRDGGAIAKGLVGVFPTVTYPSHTAMVTGRRPAESGIISNTLFDPERTLNGAWFWYAEMIKTPALWDAARQAGLTTGAVGWPVSVGARIDYNFPEYKVARNADDLLLYRTLPTPGLVAEFEKKHGELKFQGEHHDHLLSNLAAFLIESRKPHLLLVHLIDLDHDQHGFGPESPEAMRALEGIDAAVGKLRRAVDTAGVAGETRWMIVSDHGFWPVQKAFHPEAFLSSLGLTASGTDAKAWRVGTMTAGGSAAFFTKDPNDREAQAAVLRMLKTLKADGGFGIDRIVERAEMDQLKSWPKAFVAVSLAEGFTNGGGRTGAWVTGSGRTKGMHGYAPGPESLDATFLAYGPGVKKQELPRGELVDVATTAARLLGISLPSSGGKDLLAGR
ncbi:MAG: alkaline phosphatase family protein [Acidobacteria bacterium]|nr:alkaline phosphatase family protein [Acidobacteriota bacterium]